MTPQPYSILDQSDPLGYASAKRRSRLSWTIPEAPMNPAGASFDQGFSTDSPPQDNAWPGKVPLDKAAFRLDEATSSGPAGMGQSAQPEPQKPTGDISVGAANVLTGGPKKQPPPGMSARPEPEPEPAPAQVQQLPPGMAAQDTQMAAAVSGAPSPALAPPAPSLPATGRWAPPGTTVSPQVQEKLDQYKKLVDNPPAQIGERDAQGNLLRPQDIDSHTGKEKLGAKAASWGQRLALAVLSATKLSPYAQQIVRPEWTQQMEMQEAQKKGLGQEIANQEKAENIGYLGESRDAIAEQRRAQAASYATNEAERMRSNQAKEQLKNDEDFTKSLGKDDVITGLDATDPNIPQLQDQGYHVIDDSRDHREGVPKMKVAIPPRFVTVTADNQQVMTGRKMGALVPWSEYKSDLAEFQKAQRANTAAAGKPKTAEEEKLAYQGIVQKLAAEGAISPGALTDVRQLLPAIRNSKTLTPEEKNHATAYLTANPTPPAQGTNTTVRVEGMQGSREMPVLDTHNGNSPQYLNAADINEANRREPGRYIPAGIGQTALNKTSLIEDIRGNIQQVRQSLQNMPEFSAADLAKIAIAMRSRDPRSAVSSLLANVTAGSMTPQMQEYLINHAALVENAMAMRSVLGAGQGSDDMRAAITATIPGPQTPNRGYALKQLDNFEKTLNRLERGVPTVPLRNQGGTTGVPQGQATTPAGTGNIMDRWGYKPAAK